MSTFYLLHFCRLCEGQGILKDRKHLRLRDPFHEDGVESQEGKPATTPLPCKIKAKAVFEGQEARAERCSQPEKSMVARFPLA